MRTLTMLTLYQFNSCPFCCKVKALLNYAQQEYDVVEVTPFGMKELDFTDYRKVPVLRDGDQVITESATIVKYVNDNYVNLPNGEESEKWVEWLDAKLVHYLPPLIHANFKESYKNFALILSSNQFGWFKGSILRVMGSIVMPKVAKRMKKKYGIDDAKNEYLAEIDHWVDNALNGKSYFGGDKPNFVDCSVFGVLNSSHQLGVIDLAKQHNKDFATWYDACLPLMTKA